MKVERWTLMSRQRIPEIITDEMRASGDVSDADKDLVSIATLQREMQEVGFPPLS